MITTSGTAQRRSAFADQDADSTLEDAFDAHWPWVCRLLYGLVGDWDEAEDLALQVFCRLHQRPPKGPGKLSTWLYRVATNAGLNALRARQRRHRYEETAEDLRAQRAHPLDPEAEVERREARRQVQHVLAQMKPRAAQVLFLRHSGLSYAEIAMALSVAPGSVGTMLSRAEKEFERRYRALEGSNDTP